MSATDDRYLTAVQDRNAAEGYPTSPLAADLAAYFLADLREGRNWTHGRALAQNAGAGWAFTAEGQTLAPIHVSKSSVLNALNDAREALEMERAEAHRVALAQVEAAASTAQAAHEAAREEFDAAQRDVLAGRHRDDYAALGAASAAAWQAAERSRAAELLSAAAVAEQLGISVALVKRIAGEHQGQLTQVGAKLGPRDNDPWVFRPADVDTLRALMAQRRPAGRPKKASE